MNRDLRLQRFFIGPDFIQRHENLIEVFFLHNGRDFDFLDEPLPIRFKRGKPIDDVVRVAVRRAVAQGE